MCMHAIHQKGYEASMIGSYKHMGINYQLIVHGTFPMRKRLLVLAGLWLGPPSVAAAQGPCPRTRTPPNPDSVC